MWHELKTETTVPAPLDEVFDFFSQAGNLARITPESLRFEILTPSPIEMQVGALIDYRLHVNGVPMKWRTRIEEWDPPHAFADRQLKGPYRDWIHRHTFEAQGEQTLMRDQVRYRLPFFPFGQVAYPLVALQVRGIFKHREQAIREIFSEKSEKKL